MSPHRLRTYTLTLAGRLDDDFLAACCPPGASLDRQADCLRLQNLFMDQAGLIGLIRRLHNLGCALLEVSAAADEPASNQGWTE